MGAEKSFFQYLLRAYFMQKLNKIVNEYLRKKNRLKRHICIPKEFYIEIFALVHITSPSVRQ